MAKKASLLAVIGLDSKAFRRGMVRVTRSLRRVKQNIAASFKIGANIARGIAATGAAIAVAGGSAVRAKIKDAAAAAKLRAVLKSTKYASDLTSAALGKQAGTLSKMTGIGKHVITNTQAILATFKNVKGDEFQDATEAILDMSAVLDQDAQQGAIQLGKALNDPIEGITALRRVGVTFTKQQMAQIRAMQEAGDLAGAQRIILAELKSEFGGAAAAINGVDGGLANMRESFRQTLSRIGEVIISSDTFTGMVDKITKALDDLRNSGAIEAWAENAIVAFKGMLPVLTWLKDRVADVLLAVERAAAFVGGFVGAQGGIRERLEAGKDAAGQANEIMRQEREAAAAAARARRAAREKEREAKEEALKARLQAMGGGGNGGGGGAPEAARYHSLRRIGANVVRAGLKPKGDRMAEKALTIAQKQEANMAKLKDLAVQHWWRIGKNDGRF